MHLYSDIKLQSKQNPTQIFRSFDRFFFKIDKFTGINNVAVVPTGVVPPFIKASDILSPFDLYLNFSSTEAHGLVCVQFLKALNVHLGGEKNISKNAMSEFFHNLSMQAFNQSDDRIEIKFGTVNRLNKNINNLLTTEANSFRNKFEKQNLFENFVEHKTENQKFEDDVIRKILKDIKVEHPQETDQLTFPNTAEEIKRQVAEELKQKIKLDFARNKRDREIRNVYFSTQKKI